MISCTIQKQIKDKINYYANLLINDKSIKIDIIFSKKDTHTDDNVVIQDNTKKRKHSELQRDADIHKIHESWSDNDYKYWKSLSKKKRKNIDNIEYNISHTNYQHIPLRFRIINSKMPEKIKAIAINKLQNIKSNSDSKMMNYLQLLSSLPLGNYNKLSITNKDKTNVITKFFSNIEQKLNTFVYGHNEAKSQIIRLIAKWISNPNGKGLVIGLEGPPGTGKTQFGISLSDALLLPFQFIPLGGTSDGHFLTGHSYTYEGSQCGKIANSLISAKCMNPIFYLDELDKVSDTKHGDEIMNTLIHMTDSTQNDKFRDRYFSDIDLDISKSLIIFSYNDGNHINPILKDRIISIKTDPYKLNDKKIIAKNYIIPEILKEFNLDKNNFIFSDDIIKHIINLTDDEKGVRKMKHLLQEIISQINFCLLCNKPIIDDKFITIPFLITQNVIDKYIIKNNCNESWRHLYV